MGEGEDVTGESLKQVLMLCDPALSTRCSHLAAAMLPAAVPGHTSVPGGAASTARTRAGCCSVTGSPP